MSENNSGKTSFKQQAEAFQKAVSDKLNKVSQAAAGSSAAAAVPEVLSELREKAQDVFKMVREETQGVTREDIENVLRSIRNAEQLLLTRMDLLESRLLAKASAPKRKPKSAKKKSPAGKPSK